MKDKEPVLQRVEGYNRIIKFPDYPIDGRPKRNKHIIIKAEGQAMLTQLNI